MFARRCFLRRRASQSGRLERYGGRSSGVEPWQWREVSARPMSRAVSTGTTHTQQVYALEALSWDNGDELHLAQKRDLAGHEARREGKCHGLAKYSGVMQGWG